ncbi:cytochrome b561 [Pararhizobium capsulatum DSM 1112]|uniref:Cytochrome b561 n=1 Tax=Pararhizobium capsulatum DSM 1112 TaxID=1121113 RepID=A0ABU0BQ81_9HYPH|nr:cytochrome b [Pararhizobium capsulatum]MDQ0320093.1 cytochrome b561 [Pararhizobium capsulatum DSM 1112]
MWRNDKNGYGWGTIVLHWTIAILIGGLVALGYAMTRADIDPELQFQLYQWHKSFGMLALALTIIRIAWWLVNINPSHIATLSRMETRAASGVHAVLRGLTLAVPLTGWAIASTSTLAIPTFFFNLIVIPHLPFEKSAAAETFWTGVHGWLAYGLAGIVFLHATAALFHHFLRRDEVLRRMLGILPHRPASNPDTSTAGSKKWDAGQR